MEKTMADTRTPTQLLSDDHRAVLRKLDALEKIYGNLDKSDQVSAELKDLTSFFKTEFWVHFTKEEDALFPEMETFIPRNSGPIGVMLLEHDDLRKTNDIIQKAVAEYLAGNTGEATTKTIREQGGHFIALLRSHIDKEDNILFMMANMHLSQAQMDKISGVFHKIDSN